MKSFLFEQYGYYPKELIDNSFNIDGWMFKLIPTDLTNESILSIEKYVDVLNKAFQNKGPFVIKNKFNSLLSNHNNINYTLISTFITNMNFQDLLQFHYLFYSDNEYIELDKILNVWKERVDNVEKKIFSNLRVDSVFYKHNMEISLFCVGLAINSMQYLSDLIYNYGNKLYGISVVHKRLNNLNSFDFFNPFNFIVDHPLKDGVLLYQSDYITFEELEYLMLNYKLDSSSASFAMARMLYRVDVFDFLESKHQLEKSDQKINFNLEREMSKIKKAYSLLKNKYSIRPIDWLE